MPVSDIPEGRPPKPGPFPMTPPAEGPFEVLLPPSPAFPMPFEILQPPAPLPPVPGTLDIFRAPEILPPSVFLPAAPPVGPRGELFAFVPRPPSPAPAAYLRKLFNVRELWETVYGLREDPLFIEAVRGTEVTRRPVEAMLEVVAKKEEGAEYAVADFLGIPRRVVDAVAARGGDPWREVLNLTLWDVERGLVHAMPDDIPGDLVFAVDDEGRFGLVYREESPWI